jgi:hypothetical protein
VQITDDDIRRFQGIWREEFEEAITTDAARECIVRLDALYLLLYGPRARRREEIPARSEDIEHE